MRAFHLMCLSGFSAFAVGCSGGAIGDANTTSAADLTDSLSITTCSEQEVPGANYALSGDGRYLAYETCAATGEKTILRRVDLATKQTTDLEVLDRAIQLKSVPGGAAFYAYGDEGGDAIPFGTLRVWTFDGAPHRDFTGIANPKFSADGSRLLSYAETSSPAGVSGNGYGLTVRVVSLDGTVDASASFGEARGYNYVSNEYNVQAAAFSPDQSQVVFTRRIENDTVTTRFDIATQTIVARDLWMTNAAYAFLDSYDGASIVYTVADSGPSVLHVASRGNAATAPLSGSLFDLNDSGSAYVAHTCSIEVGGAFVFWSQDDASPGGAKLRVWDSVNGARDLLSVPSAFAPLAPRECPTVGPSGKYLEYRTNASPGASSTFVVLPLAAGAAPVTLDAPAGADLPTDVELAMTERYVALVPTEPIHDSPPITVLDVTNGVKTQIATTPATGTFASPGSASDPAAIFTAAGALVVLRAKPLGAPSVWTANPNDTSIADAGLSLSVPAYPTVTLEAIPRSSRFLAITQSSWVEYQLTIATP